MNKDIIAIFEHKTGDSRNNHSVFTMVNYLRNSSDPYRQLLGTLLANRGWYLTGEAELPDDFWRKSPAGLYYGIETMRNFWVAQQIMKDTTRTKISAQVANPESKGEVGNVSPINDWTITMWCAQQMGHAIEYHQVHGVFPPDFVDTSSSD